MFCLVVLKGGFQIFSRHLNLIKCVHFSSDECTEKEHLDLNILNFQNKSRNILNYTIRWKNNKSLKTFNIK